MKEKISIFLILYSYTLLAQQLEVFDTSMIISSGYNDVKFVQSCDTNSSVVGLTMAMGVSKLKLPSAVITKKSIYYRLKSKTKNVVFSFHKEQDNKISVWINETEKHCFIIDSSYHYSFKTYSLSNKYLEVYGKMSWDKFYRNFRIIFYPKSKKVLFDFDDGIFRQK